MRNLESEIFFLKEELQSIDFYVREKVANTSLAYLALVHALINHVCYDSFGVLYFRKTPNYLLALAFFNYFLLDHKKLAIFNNF